MTDQELDELLTHRWPGIVRRVMSDGSDEWIKGFVRSIARHAKRPTWRPSPKQEHIMRRLAAELATDPQGELELIEE
jgi:hypothetical protein